MENRSTPASSNSVANACRRAWVSWSAPSSGGNRDKTRPASILTGDPGSAPDQIIVTTGISGRQALRRLRTPVQRLHGRRSTRRSAQSKATTTLVGCRSRRLCASRKRFSSTSNLLHLPHEAAGVASQRVSCANRVVRAQINGRFLHYSFCSLSLGSLLRLAVHVTDGRCLCQSVSRSNILAVRSSRSSSNGGASNCSPIGKRPWLKPAGIEMPGSPARLALIV